MYIHYTINFVLKNEVLMSRFKTVLTLKNVEKTRIEKIFKIRAFSENFQRLPVLLIH